LKKLSNAPILFNELLKCLFNSTYHSAIDKDHYLGGSIEVGDTLLFDSNISGADEEMTINKEDY